MCFGFLTIVLIEWSRVIEWKNTFFIKFAFVSHLSWINWEHSIALSQRSRSRQRWCQGSNSLVCCNGQSALGSRQSIARSRGRSQWQLEKYVHSTCGDGAARLLRRASPALPIRRRYRRCLQVWSGLNYPKVDLEIYFWIPMLFLRLMTGLPGFPITITATYHHLKCFACLLLHGAKPDLSELLEQNLDLPPYVITQCSVPHAIIKYR